MMINSEPLVRRVNPWKFCWNDDMIRAPGEEDES
jgi:hypothetical protein